MAMGEDKTNPRIAQYVTEPKWVISVSISLAQRKKPVRIPRPKGSRIKNSAQAEEKLRRAMLLKKWLTDVRRGW